MRNRLVIGGLLGLGLIMGSCASEPKEPVVIIKEAQFKDFMERHNVGPAIASVQSCPPGTPKSLYNVLKIKAIEHGANLVVLDKEPEQSVPCYSGVVYKFE